MRLLLTANTCMASQEHRLACRCRHVQLACGSFSVLDAPCSGTGNLSVTQNTRGRRNEADAQALGAPRKATRAKYCRKPKTLACVMLERKRRAGHEVVQSSIGIGTVPISYMIAQRGQQHGSAER